MYALLLIFSLAWFVVALLAVVEWLVAPTLHIDDPNQEEQDAD
jgi:hypothetical protein